MVARPVRQELLASEKCRKDGRQEIGRTSRFETVPCELDDDAADVGTRRFAVVGAAGAADEDAAADDDCLAGCEWSDAVKGGEGQLEAPRASKPRTRGDAPLLLLPVAPSASPLPPFLNRSALANAPASAPSGTAGSAYEFGPDTLLGLGWGNRGAWVNMACRREEEGCEVARGREEGLGRSDRPRICGWGRGGWPEEAVVLAGEGSARVCGWAGVGRGRAGGSRGRPRAADASLNRPARNEAPRKTSRRPQLSLDSLGQGSAQAALERNRNGIADVQRSVRLPRKPRARTTPWVRARARGKEPKAQPLSGAFLAAPGLPLPLAPFLPFAPPAAGTGAGGGRCEDGTEAASAGPASGAGGDVASRGGRAASSSAV